MDAAATRAQPVSEPLHPDVRTLPREGDVVVTRESGAAATYTVRQLPGVVQFHVSARDEAMQLARSFAQRAVVDLWYSENGAYRLLEAYRREGA